MVEHLASYSSGTSSSYWSREKDYYIYTRFVGLHWQNWISALFYCPDSFIYITSSSSFAFSSKTIRFSQQRMIPFIAAVNLSLKQAKNQHLNHLDAPVNLPDHWQSCNSTFFASVLISGYQQESTNRSCISSLLLLSLPIWCNLLSFKKVRLDSDSNSNNNIISSTSTAWPLSLFPQHDSKYHLQSGLY